MDRSQSTSSRSKAAKNVPLADSFDPSSSDGEDSSDADDFLSQDDDAEELGEVILERDTALLRVKELEMELAKLKEAGSNTSDTPAASSTAPTESLTAQSPSGRSIVGATTSLPPSSSQNSSGPVSTQPLRTATAIDLDQQIKILERILALSDEEQLAVLRSEKSFLGLQTLSEHYFEDTSNFENDLKNPGGVRRLVEASRARYLGRRTDLPQAVRSRPIGPILVGSTEDRFQGELASGLCRRGTRIYKPVAWDPSLYNKTFRQSSSSKDSFTIWALEEKIMINNACFVMTYTPCWRPMAEKVMMSSMLPFFKNGGTHIVLTAQSELENDGLLGLLSWKKQIESSTPGRLGIFFIRNPIIGDSNFHSKFQWIVDWRTGSIVTLSGSPNGTNSGKGFKARFASSLEQARKAGRSDEEIYVYAHERFADGVGSGWELLLKEEEMLRALIDDGRLIMGMPHLYKPRDPTEVDYAAVTKAAMHAYHRDASNFAATKDQAEQSQQLQQRIASATIEAISATTSATSVALSSPTFVPSNQTWRDIVATPNRENLNLQASMRVTKTRDTEETKLAKKERSEQRARAKQLGIHLGQVLNPDSNPEEVLSYARAIRHGLLPDGESMPERRKKYDPNYVRPEKQKPNPGTIIAYDGPLELKITSSTPALKDRSLGAHYRHHACKKSDVVVTRSKTTKTCSSCGTTFDTNDLVRLHQALNLTLLEEGCKESGDAQSLNTWKDKKIRSLVEEALPDGDFRGEWGRGYGDSH